MTLGFFRTPGHGMPDGSILAAKWLELGSLDKISAWLYGQGFVNSNTGLPISRQAIHQKIWNWVFKSDENIATIKNLVMKSHHARGISWNEDWWIEFILRKAVKNIPSKNFTDWANSRGYGDYIAKIYSSPTTRGF